MVKDVVVVLPSLNPDRHLLETVAGVIKKGFDKILIVDDGSDEEHKKYFTACEKAPGVFVLHHEVNKGKGAALKTAFKYLYENLGSDENFAGVVTIDGDGQHDPFDILSCANKMKETGTVVLGCRDFSDKSVPWKSKAGNNITKFVFRLFCGLKISDTQTGLRAIPKKYLKDMIEIEGDRFEYETNMLLEMKTRQIPLSEVKIRTLYEDKINSTSHFNPFRDSFKIYAIILKYLFSSGASSLIDLLAFFLFSLLFTKIVTTGFSLFGHDFPADWIIVYASTFFARLISSFFNYKMNKHVVFKSTTKGTLGRYYLLALVQLILSACFVSLLSILFSAGSVLKTVCKAFVDVVLFFISFRIQQAWVFKKEQN